jgi:hypothetical protein
MKMFGIGNLPVGDIMKVEMIEVRRIHSIWITARVAPVSPTIHNHVEMTSDGEVENE